jgi:hypothetical protein
MERVIALNDGRTLSGEDKGDDTFFVAGKT